MRHFLQYWKPNQIAIMAGKPLDHAGSAQFRRVSSGDVVWIVTVHNGRLKLLGRIRVAEVVSRDNAVRRFGEAYDAPLQIIGIEGTVLTMMEHDIQRIAAELRFESPTHPKLVLTDPNRIDGKQMQAIRKLTYPSAMLLAHEIGESEEDYEELDAQNGVRRNPPWSRDEVILALDTYFRHNPSHIHQDNPAILDLSNTLRSLAERLGQTSAPDFRNRNGAYMKLCNFLHLDPEYQGEGLSSVSAMDRSVWDQFSKRRNDLHLLAESIRATVQDVAEVLPDTSSEEDEAEFPEGALKYRQHVSRERSQRLIKQAKARAKKAHGILKCEVCDFNFGATYGPIGEDFIECHHTIPVSQLMPGSKTRVADVALLCSNCHRMVHRRRPWLGLQELRSLMQLKVSARTGA
jgi:5-methylcytosine-specific restriction protein A